MIEITQLNIFPVKALHGISAPAWTLTSRGLAFDRAWAVVDSDGLAVSQRDIPAMARIQVAFDSDEVELREAELPPLRLPVNPANAHNNQLISVRVWDDVCRGIDLGEAASRWLTAALGAWQGRELHLVRFASEHKRLVAAEFLRGEDAHSAFSDGFPFLIANESSLELLNQNLEKNGTPAVPMSRFRPNIVVRGITALAENNLAGLAQVDGRYRLDLRKPCQRCVVTTIDQESGDFGAVRQEPLRTLARMQTIPGQNAAFFGQNAILISGENEMIRVGDRLEVVVA